MAVKQKKRVQREVPDPPLLPELSRPKLKLNPLDEGVRKVEKIHRQLGPEAFPDVQSYELYTLVHNLPMVAPSTVVAVAKEHVSNVIPFSPPATTSQDDAIRYEHWLRAREPMGFTKGVHTEGVIESIGTDRDGTEIKLECQIRTDTIDESYRYVGGCLSHRPGRYRVITLKVDYVPIEGTSKVRKINKVGMHWVEIPNPDYLAVTWVGRTQHQDPKAWDRMRSVCIRRTKGSESRRRRTKRPLSTGNMNLFRSGSGPALNSLPPTLWEQLKNPSGLSASRTEYWPNGYVEATNLVGDEWPSQEAVNAVRYLKGGNTRDSIIRSVETAGITIRNAALKAQLDPVSEPLVPLLGTDWPAQTTGSSCLSCGIEAWNMMADGVISSCASCNNKAWNTTAANQASFAEVLRPRYDSECLVCSGNTEINSLGFTQCVECGFSESVGKFEIDLKGDPVDALVNLRELERFYSTRLEDVQRMIHDVTLEEERNFMYRLQKRARSLPVREFTPTRSSRPTVNRRSEWLKYHLRQLNDDATEVMLRDKAAEKWPSIQSDEKNEIEVTRDWFIGNQPVDMFEVPDEWDPYVPAPWSLADRIASRCQRLTDLGYVRAVINRWNKSGKMTAGSEFSAHLTSVLHMVDRWELKWYGYEDSKLSFRDLGNRFEEDRYDLPIEEREAYPPAVAKLRPHAWCSLSPFTRWAYKVHDETHDPVTVRIPFKVKLIDLKKPTRQSVGLGRVYPTIRVIDYVYDMDPKPPSVAPRSGKKKSRARTFLNKVKAAFSTPVPKAKPRFYERTSIDKSKYLPTPSFRRWLKGDEARYQSYWDSVPKRPIVRETVRSEEPTLELIEATKYVPPDPIIPVSREDVQKVSEFVDTISAYAYALMKNGAVSEVAIKEHNRKLKDYLAGAVIIGESEGQRRIIVPR